MPCERMRFKAVSHVKLPYVVGEVERQFGFTARQNDLHHVQGCHVAEAPYQTMTSAITTQTRRMVLKCTQLALYHV